MKIVNHVNDIKQLTNQVFLHYTGNMFGFGASVYNYEAIQKIDLIKGRNSEKSYICLFDSIQTIIDENILNKEQYKIIRFLNKIWPENLTVILPVTNERYQKVSKDGYVAIRVPTCRFLREWLSLVGPIISTSVNKANEKPLDHLDDIIQEFGEYLDFAIVEDSLMSNVSGPSTLIKLENESFTVLRQGTYSSDLLKEMYSEIKISFACIGNTCRSPIAEFYAKKVLTDLPYNIQVSSFGLNESGHPISVNSEFILNQMGIDAKHHCSTQVSMEIIEKNDYVLTMTEEIKNRIITLYPQYAYKILTLGELSGLNGDVDDPYGNDIHTYQKTAQIIIKMIDQLRYKILNKEI